MPELREFDGVQLTEWCAGEVLRSREGSGETMKKKLRTAWTARWTKENAISVGTFSAKAKAEYVAWIDLMGARGWMAGSIEKAAEMIAIIHVAGMRAVYDHNVKAYPVIDGVYLVGEHKADFLAATRATMRDLALTFLHRTPENRFLVRGGIAYGSILHGENIAELHSDLSTDQQYARCLALGISIGQAYGAEKNSPPFGYYVDMTARSAASFNDAPYTSAFFAGGTRV
jgi:hypothetical protein